MSSARPAVAVACAVLALVAVLEGVKVALSLSFSIAAAALTAAFRLAAALLGWLVVVPQFLGRVLLAVVSLLWWAFVGLVLSPRLMSALVFVPVTFWLGVRAVRAIVAPVRLTAVLPALVPAARDVTLSLVGAGFKANRKFLVRIRHWTSASGASVRSAAPLPAGLFARLRVRCTGGQPTPDTVYQGPGVFVAANKINVQVPADALAEPGVYEVLVSQSHGAHFSNAAAFAVHPPPHIIFAQPDTFLANTQAKMALFFEPLPDPQALSAVQPVVTFSSADGSMSLSVPATLQDDHLELMAPALPVPRFGAAPVFLDISLNGLHSTQTREFSVRVMDRQYMHVVDSSFLVDMRLMFENHRLADVEFHCADGKDVLAHRCVLGARNPTMLAFFMNTQPGAAPSPGELPLTHITVPVSSLVLREFLQFHYTALRVDTAVVDMAQLEYLLDNWCTTSVRRQFVEAPRDSPSLPLVARLNAIDRVSSELYGLQQRGNLCDFAVHVPPPANDTSDSQLVTFHCHAAVLAARNSFFSSMLESASLWKESVMRRVLLHDAQPADVAQVLRYLYRDAVELDDDTMLGVFVLAERYLQPRLVQLAARDLAASLEPDSCLAVYWAAHMHQNAPLVRLAAQFIASTFDHVRSSQPQLLLRVCSHRELYDTLVALQPPLAKHLPKPSRWMTYGQLPRFGRSDSAVIASASAASAAPGAGSGAKAAGAAEEEKRCALL